MATRYRQHVFAVLGVYLIESALVIFRVSRIAEPVVGTRFGLFLVRPVLQTECLVALPVFDTVLE